jgi:tRNA pseudouridine55 synthase
MADSPGGVIVVDKPTGPTSHDIVAAVRRLVRPSRTGHTGTLDPLATGVLPVCVGAATRLSRFLARGPKHYEGVMRLGSSTDTYDSAGRVLHQSAVAGVDDAVLREAAVTFTGDLLQVPPPWSAKRVGGRRAYELAREGSVPKLEPCAVRVDRFDVSLSGDGTAAFRVVCSTGTYVRSLVHELGAALGCGAHLTALRRVRSGPFDIEGSIDPGALQGPGAREALRAAMIPLEALDLGLPTARLTRAGAVAALNGRMVPSSELPAQPEGIGAEMRMLDEAGRLLGVGEAAPGGLRPRIILAGTPVGHP